MPEQVSLQGNLSVGQLPDGHVALVMDVGGGRSYVMGMPPDVAQTIGKALLAPSVAIPDGPLAAANGRS